LEWVVRRHSAIYAEEYGWDNRFGSLVAEVVAQYAGSKDPECERGWIARRAGENVGCVFLVRQSKEVAQLRLLLVEPSARGLGIGRQLIQECMNFGRRCRYRKIMLWTNDVLVAARHLYEEAGFHLVHEERHCRFGPKITGQTWEAALQSAIKGKDLPCVGSVGGRVQ
jgi:GNAT superfamily N-acetyltransferase